MTTQTMRERLVEQVPVNINVKDYAQFDIYLEKIVAFIEQELTLARAEEGEKCNEHIKKAQQDLINEILSVFHERFQKKA